MISALIIDLESNLNLDFKITESTMTIGVGGYINILCIRSESFVVGILHAKSTCKILLFGVFICEK
jgi:hypothetical protein